MENLAPTGIRSPDRPARSHSLYRRRYSAHSFRSNRYEFRLRGGATKGWKSSGPRVLWIRSKRAAVCCVVSVTWPSITKTSAMYRVFPILLDRKAQARPFAGLSTSVASLTRFNPYPTAFPYGNGMVLHFHQQQESSTTKTVHKVINKGLKTYV